MESSAATAEVVEVVAEAEALTAGAAALVAAPQLVAEIEPHQSQTWWTHFCGSSCGSAG